MASACPIWFFIIFWHVESFLGLSQCFDVFYATLTTFMIYRHNCIFPLFTLPLISPNKVKENYFFGKKGFPHFSSFVYVLAINPTSERVNSRENLTTNKLSSSFWNICTGTGVSYSSVVVFTLFYFFTIWEDGVFEKLLQGARLAPRNQDQNVGVSCIDHMAVKYKIYIMLRLNFCIL